MPRVTYVQANGEAVSVDMTAGRTLMDGALDNGVPGIIGQCGGACTCTTCHCYVSREWRAGVPPPAADEQEMLEWVIEPRAGSRLACQIVMTDELDGIVLRLPTRQTN